ncbi:putative quinol monooxygenase [Paenibacillus hamazuiensis]|uniref:putative quinol monooxygenase n=1 Tax=Paenibacillus hamazuiensis TaxID=2936508 RepID=UPI00200FAC5A|nr:antibiotic biosynthesis monooxygenase family protein [Paenibacillus hamazuiensis]
MSLFAMFGKLTAHEGKRDELVQHLLEATKQKEAMEGCLLYVINEAEDDPNDVWVTEMWRDAESHAASLKNEAVLATIRRCMPLVAGVHPIKIRPVGGIGIDRLQTP